jgi:predicted exporter
MKKILRYLLLQHLSRPKNLWILVGIITAALAFGSFRIERQLDLMSLLPTDHPVVKASLQAGVGQNELLWAVAEGGPQDLNSRRAWADSIIEELMDKSSMPINGIDDKGGLSPALPVPIEGTIEGGHIEGPVDKSLMPINGIDGGGSAPPSERKGVSLWPPLLAASSLLDGDGDVGRLLTEHVYAIGPMLLGDGLKPLQDPDQLRERFKKTAKALASPDPLPAKLAQMDPLGLLDMLPQDGASIGSVTQAASSFPLQIKNCHIESKDGRYLILPLTLNFPNGETANTGRVLAWVANGCVGGPPAKASVKGVEAAMRPNADRTFPIKVTGAHAIAYWESNSLGKEVVFSLSLCLVFIAIVYWAGFRTLAGYLYVVAPLLLGMLWTLGMAGWILGRLNLMAAAFGAVLLGVGHDSGLLIFSRYRDERMAGRGKALALRAALLSTGPGVIAGMTATSLAFLACMIAPFPGFRDLGLTAGLGILSCLVATFLLMPPMLLALDRGKGVFAPTASKAPLPMREPSRWKALSAVAIIAFACIGLSRLNWEEDLRRFRQVGNPALELQADLGKLLGAGIQPLGIQIPLDGPAPLPQRWNHIADLLVAEGFAMPRWANMGNELRDGLSSDAWLNQALGLAEKEGLEPKALERPLASLKASVADPLYAPRALMRLLDPPQAPDNAAQPANKAKGGGSGPAMLTLPVRLSETAQDKVEAALEGTGARLVGTRPLFKALKSVAKQSLLEVIAAAMAVIIGIIAIFGRRWLFLLLALIPMAAGQIAVLGTLGWTGEPLTFLSLVAIPVTLGVSVDTVFNLLNRARIEINAPAKVARVNAVCAGTTVASFGGLALSGYRGLQGLGIAAIGGTAVALLTTQWLLPWILEKWPLKKR